LKIIEDYKFNGRVQSAIQRCKRVNKVKKVNIRPALKLLKYFEKNLAWTDPYIIFYPKNVDNDGSIAILFTFNNKKYHIDLAYYDPEAWISATINNVLTIRTCKINDILSTLSEFNDQ
jgi:hypothetical protein